jgi:class 3 adenylate cyclase
VGRLPEDLRLAQWAKAIEDLGWAAWLVDSDFRLVWTSSESDQFLGSPTEEELGYGRHIVEAFTQEAWLRITTPEGQLQVFQEVVPYLLSKVEGSQADLWERAPTHLAALLDQIHRKPMPAVFSTSFDYVDPRGGPDEPPYRVDLLIMPIHDEHDQRIGILGISYMGVRPTLVSLLARGQHEMYERMARLVQPKARQAAILFCDLQGSAELSRKLPTAAYFRLIRRLWTDIDTTVADNYGIVGKHAGDGASAFFLVEDLGSPSATAAAAIATARTIHERSAAVSKDVLASPCVMRVGLHWGDTIYLGQLVPGGRLDITALGDAVNECARIEECATSGTTLASKELIERLDADHAAATGLDLERISYRLVSELPVVSEKARRDIGGFAVAEV